MSAKVFISYRREDSKWQAREIYRSLTQVLPRTHVFMDIDSIPPGADFVDVLEGWVNQCDILLAIIGPSWIDIFDPKTNRRRLENTNDFVRIEVRKGLERGIPVVPVLLDGAPIPDVEKLPDDLKRLVRRNAEFIEHRTVDTDVERLIRKLGLVQNGGGSASVARAADPPLVGVSRNSNAEGRIKVDAKIVHGAPDGWFKPGAGKTEWFADHEHGPEMVVAPAGKFMMGSPASEPGRWNKESLDKYDWFGAEDQHSVTLASPFAIARHAVTRGQFSAFVQATGYKTETGAVIWARDKWVNDPNGSWRNPGFAQDETHPVVCISWSEVSAYAAWLTRITGRTYRLLSEAEWEYAARAGTTTAFWFGDKITTEQTNYNGEYVYASSSKGLHRDATVTVGNFAPNPWGLHQMHGNVKEWCADVWHRTYEGAPADGTIWSAGGDPNRRICRGGSWNDLPQFLRSAYRDGSNSTSRQNTVGFRVGRTLSP